MIFRISTILVFGLVLCTCCNRGEQAGEQSGRISGDRVAIRGRLGEGAGKTVILEEMGARELIPVDTVTCDDTGSFEITFSPGEVSFYILRLGGPGYITLLIEPGESLMIRGTYGKDHPYEVTGSPGSELLRELAAAHKKTLDALAEISRKNREVAGSPDYAAVKARLDRKFDSITADFTDYSLRFIHRNPHSLAILVALYNLYGPGLPVFSPDQYMYVYRFVDSTLMSAYSGFEAVELLHAQIEEADRQLSRKNPVQILHKGDIAPDFVSSQPDGQEIALSDLKGNYVLLCFWAGWSKPSREENRYLKKAYELYGDRPFRILQVSLDSNRGQWLQAIEEDGLVWDQVSDLRRWDSLVAGLYHVEKIPSNVLIDPSGKIIDTDLFGERLIERLDTIFES